VKNMMYHAVYTDTGKNHKTMTRKTVGAGQELKFTILDENDAIVNLTTVTTNMKIYVGTLAEQEIAGGTITLVGAATLGTVKYPLATTDFDEEADIGTHAVELQFGTNATIGSSTSTIRTGGLTLSVLDTISD